MGQWDVHNNPVARAREEIPYLVVVQSDLLDFLPTRLVLPLSRSKVAPLGLPARMAPTFDLLGETLTLKPHEAGAVPARTLGPAIANLRQDRWDLVDAFDTVISGV